MRRSPERGHPQELEQTPVQKYWAQYNFSGMAPPPGSPVEERLLNICQQYVKICLETTDSGRVTPSPNVQKEALQHYTKLESERRMLHNQIAIMTLGSIRSKLPEHEAKRIADFAAQVTNNGLRMNDLEELQKSEPEE